VVLFYDKQPTELTLSCTFPCLPSAAADPGFQYGGFSGNLGDTSSVQGRRLGIWGTEKSWLGSLGTVGDFVPQNLVTYWKCDSYISQEIKTVVC